MRTEAPKTITKLMLIALSVGMLCGCSTSGIGDTAQDEREEAASSKDEELSVEVFQSEIVKDLLEKKNDRILEFFSDSTVEKYGEDHIRGRLEMAESLLQGEYVEEKLKHSGKPVHGAEKERILIIILSN